MHWWGNDTQYIWHWNYLNCGVKRVEQIGNDEVQLYFKYLMVPGEKKASTSNLLQQKFFGDD